MSLPRTRSPLNATLPLGTPSESPTPADRTRSPIEVETHDVHTGPALAANSHRVVEIWTRKRVYTLDSLMVCQEVIQLDTGQSVPNHPLLGSRLVGGQIHREHGDELVFPLPVPGAEAVFQKLDAKARMRLQVTSRVTRVTLHIRRVRVRVAHRDEAWNRLTTSGGHQSP